MKLKQHKSLGEITRTIHEEGTLLSIDYENDTGTVQIDDKGTFSNVPFYFHCSPQARGKTKKSEALVGAAGAFVKGDRVLARLEWKDKEWAKPRIISLVSGIDRLYPGRTVEWQRPCFFCRIKLTRYDGHVFTPDDITGLKDAVFNGIYSYWYRSEQWVEGWETEAQQGGPCGSSGCEWMMVGSIPVFYDLENNPEKDYIVEHQYGQPYGNCTFDYGLKEWLLEIPYAEQPVRPGLAITYTNLGKKPPEVGSGAPRDNGIWDDDHPLRYSQMQSGFNFANDIHAQHIRYKYERTYNFVYGGSTWHLGYGWWKSAGTWPNGMDKGDEVLPELHVLPNETVHATVGKWREWEANYPIIWHYDAAQANVDWPTLRGRVPGLTSSYGYMPDVDSTDYVGLIWVAYNAPDNTLGDGRMDAWTNEIHIYSWAYYLPSGAQRRVTIFGPPDMVLKRRVAQSEGHPHPNSSASKPNTSGLASTFINATLTATQVGDDPCTVNSHDEITLYGDQTAGVQLFDHTVEAAPNTVTFRDGKTIQTPGWLITVTGHPERFEPQHTGIDPRQVLGDVNASCDCEIEEHGPPLAARLQHSNLFKFSFGTHSF